MPTLSAEWRKSSRSGSQGSCVEVRLVDGVVQVRDTKLGGASPILDVPASGWAALAARVKDGAFDL